MEGYPKKDDGCPLLLDLIPKDREWITKRAEETSHGVSEEKKLELTLGPPRGEWTTTCTEKEEGLLSLGCFLTSPSPQNPVLKSPSPSPWQTHSSYLHLQSGERQVAVNKESSQPCSNTLHSSGSAQKRTAPASVVGWPPIRSFRKNIASGTASKQASPTPDSAPRKVENCSKSLFVKINMDGIPIGRKVDVKAYNSYEKLSLAVDELFKGLLAAQKDGGKEIRGLLDGSEEYTLVYEDNEGDRMLVGDVPWDMFVSTVKRLRLLRSSELHSVCHGRKQGKRVA